MQTIRTIGQVLLLSSLVLGAAACGKKSPVTSKPEEPQRNGTDLESVSGKFNDLEPVLSADGTRILFISARDSSDVAPTRKAYKSEWLAAQAPGAPVRVTAVDLGLERQATLSPDGNWIAIVASNAGRTELYLQDFAGASAPVRITDDALEDAEPVFSPDSKLLAWIARDAASGTAAAVVVALGGGTEAEVLRLGVFVSQPTEFVTLIGWLPVESGYRLLTATPAPVAAGLTNVSYFDFVAAPDAQAAVRTPWLDAVPLSSNVEPRLAATKGMFARRVLPVGSKLSTAGGGGETPQRMPVKNEAVFADPTVAGAVAEFADPPGHEVLALGGLTADGTSGIFVARSVYRCDPAAKTYLYGTSIILAATDATSFTRFVPRISPAGFDVAKDFCDTKRADETSGRVDDKILAATVNANATPTKMRILYVTRFTNVFDAACNLKAGDPEILAMEVDGDAKAVAPVSNFRAPIVDSPRGAAAACVL